MLAEAIWGIHKWYCSVNILKNHLGATKKEDKESLFCCLFSISHLKWLEDIFRNICIKFDKTGVNTLIN